MRRLLVPPFMALAACSSPGEPPNAFDQVFKGSRGVAEKSVSDACLQARDLGLRIAGDDDAKKMQVYTDYAACMAPLTKSDPEIVIR